MRIDHNLWTRLPIPDENSLEGPLIGDRRRRTALVLAYLVGFTTLFALSYAATTVTVGGEHLETYTTWFDSLTALVIFLATVTMTVVPLVYAVWNGGPGFAFTIPLVPIFLGELATGRFVLGLDAIIALTVGATACILALYATDVRRTQSLRPWRLQAIDEETVLIVTGLTILSGVGTVRFVTTAPAHAVEWYAPFSILWAVTGGVLLTYWLTWLQLAVTDHFETPST